MMMMTRVPSLFLLLALLVSPCHCFTTPSQRRQSSVLAPPLQSSPTAAAATTEEEDKPSILSIIMEAEGAGEFDSDGNNNEAADEEAEEAEVVSEIPEDAVISRAYTSRCIKGVAKRTCALNEEVARLADVPLAEANELIDLGAVWARMETLTEEDVLNQYSGSTSGSSGTSAKYADLPKGWGSGEWAEDEGQEEDLDAYIDMMANQRYRRILTASMVERGTDIRIYPKPRRFPACYELTRDRLLYEDTTFIVVDKPPLLPTQPDASNYQECCPGCVNELMGPFETIINEPVVRPLLCHRVDSVVGGCVVMSKDQNGQKVFSELQRERKLKKVYLAVTNNPVPTGMHLQWMWAPQAARGKSGGPPCQLVSHTPPVSRRKARQFWIRCVLEVVNCEPIAIEKGAGHGYDPEDKSHYQSTIRLVTGRKHQVRAQLASLGAPIIRDTLYQPMSGYTLDKLEDDEGNMDDALAKCKVPTLPIGLQAHAILFGGIRAKANTPWWGDGSVE